MSDNIPTDIYRKILVRLRPENLVRFTAVCKSWQQIIEDEYFIKYYFAANNMGDNHNLLIRTKGNDHVLISLNSLYETNNANIEPISAYNELEKYKFPVATCNGLVLAVDIQNNLEAVWNPLTGACHNIPSFKTLPGTRWSQRSPTGYRKGADTFVGFGYDKVTDDYKVVRLFAFDYSIINALVYCLKSGVWRRINRINEYTIRPSLLGHEGGVFFRGAIHWIAGYGRLGMSCIWALDLSNEKYHQISLPPLSQLYKKFKHNLCVLNDCLVLSNAYSWSFASGIIAYDVWILNDYGGKEIWSKLFSVDLLSSAPHNPYLFETSVLAYIKSKELVLIQYGNEGFLWYHLRTGYGKKVTIKGLKLSCPSPQVLRSSLKGGYMKETLGSTKWLELELTTSSVSF